ncbi:PT domain-containing protein [Gorillibacterium massiliense]|uniref:PT domain-containing protein n=1 Tax=Gorillibacterium massiliense TaxID=1280390 RepID=UPI0004AD5679|nr:PT domain-containing protein [Gorillibacterium massiliense]
MNEQKIPWYDRLKSPVFKEKTFTRDLAREIERRGFASGGIKRRRPWFAPSAVTVCFIALAGLLVFRFSGWELQKTTVLNPSPMPVVTAQPTAVPTIAPTATPAPQESSSPEPTGKPPVSPQAVKWNPKLASQVTITVADEPKVGIRVWNRIAISVTEGTQTFAMSFAEPMNRESVEKTLRGNLSKIQTPYESSSEKIPDLTFEWKSDTEVLVTASTVAGGNFVLDARKARTSSGTILERTAVLDVIVSKAGQIWRVSLEGKGSEKVADLAKPYPLQTDGDSDGPVFAVRYTESCECDAPIERLYNLVDPESGMLTAYDGKLFTSYEGPGHFVADTRGFFYTASENAGSPPAKGETAYSVDVGGYVFGTGFTKDHSLLLIAAGDQKEPKGKPLDLIVYRLADGSMKRLSGALNGVLETDPLNGGYEPVRFIPYGGRIVTNMSATADRDGRLLAYDVAKGGVVIWNKPSGDAYPVSFTDDGKYGIYSDGAFYTDESVMDTKIQMSNWGMWIPGTHKYLHITGLSGRYGAVMQLWDADTGGQDEVANVVVPENSQLIGISKDGKYAYINIAGAWNGTSVEQPEGGEIGAPKG